MIPVHKVESSYVSGIGYDPVTKTLRVEHKDGKAYDYEGVSAESYMSVISAESIGKALHEFVKKAGHEGKRVEL